MARNHIEPDITHPHLIVVTVKDERRLSQFCEKMDRHGIVYEPFYESDLGGRLTCVASGIVKGGTRKIFANLPLLKGEKNEDKEIN